MPVSCENLVLRSAPKLRGLWFRGDGLSLRRVTLSWMEELGRDTDPLHLSAATSLCHLEVVNSVSKVVVSRQPDHCECDCSVEVLRREN